MIEQLPVENIQLLEIKTAHILKISVLDFHHKDPFDRILIAQTLTEKIKIISNEDIFDKYDVNRIW